ncbi:MAG: hypothetical protein IJ215_02005 [Clostridia bacterium]|nr:hypothetical protein [Clostridia bacterium]
MSEKLVEFLKKYLGFIVGVIIGIIVVVCGIGNFIVTLAIIIGFGYLGMYIQKNKSSVKVVLKNLIEKW